MADLRLATGPVSMGNRGFPPPNKAALAAVWGGHLPQSTDLAAARQVHGSLVHVCAPPIMNAKGEDENAQG
eukprot:6599471-Pyramimonas_sp.AAC.1